MSDIPLAGVQRFMWMCPSALRSFGIIHLHLLNSICTPPNHGLCLITVPQTSFY